MKLVVENKEVLVSGPYIVVYVTRAILKYGLDASVGNRWERWFVVDTRDGELIISRNTWMDAKRIAYSCNIKVAEKAKLTLVFSRPKTWLERMQAEADKFRSNTERHRNRSNDRAKRGLK